MLQATGKNFVMDNKFNLGNLLDLGLHNYVDACSEIVDRAQKELIIEKALKKIDETWSSLSLTFSPYQDTDNVQMTVEDSITEALETDNLALQTMSSGKYVQVSAWPDDCYILLLTSCMLTVHAILLSVATFAISQLPVTVDGPSLWSIVCRAHELCLHLHSNLAFQYRSLCTKCKHCAGQSQVPRDCHELAEKAWHSRCGAQHMAGCPKEMASLGIYLCGQC